MKRIKLARGFICSTDSRFANQPRSVNCCTNPRNRELCPYDGDRARLKKKSREGTQGKEQTTKKQGKEKGERPSLHQKSREGKEKKRN